MKRNHPSFRQNIHKAFNNPSSPHFKTTNNFFALVTIISLVVLVADTMPQLASLHETFRIIEYLALVVFALEYLLRLFSTPKPLSYAFSFFGIIDLLAIIPSYLGFNMLALKSARILRILRFLRLLRLAKMARLATHHEASDDIETLYRINVVIYILAVTGILLTLGTIMYTLEGHTGAFESIPRSMIWVLEVMVDSSRVITPQTNAGASIEVFGRFMGFVLLGFLIHIVGGYVNTLLLGTKKSHKTAATKGEEI